VEAFSGSGNPVLRYLAILRAGRDFGLSQREIEAVAGRFDPRRARCQQLADAFADLIAARSDFDLPAT
jgi:hypothetical protein